MSETSTINGSIYNVLIVDDVPKNIQVVANILKQEGYRMGFAQDGSTALRLVQQNDFDLILLDVMMPGMDGFTVCQKLKEEPHSRDIPVIFLTARTESEDLVKGFEVGAVDYVTKPFNSHELLARVRTHLELKTAREKLVQTNLQLTELNATKDKFFSIISHDLRNPIQVLLLSSELLKENFEHMEQEKIKKYIDKFHSGSNLISDLLEHLLEWSRSQRGIIECVCETISLQKMVEKCKQMLYSQAESKDIELHMEIETDLKINADRKMLQTILRNLLSNAIKFTPKGGKVHLESYNVNREQKNFIEIVVSDTGVGMTDDDREALFRIDTTKSTRGTNGESGTGLGLILCKEFIDKHQGEIQVQSELGKGSRFIVSLPA